MHAVNDAPEQPLYTFVWYPSAAQVVQIHDDVLALGGDSSPGVDLAKFDGALNRPRWRMRYEGEQDVLVLAVALASSIANAHAFIDGNKRTAYAVLAVFLDLHGVDSMIEPGDISVASWIEQLVIAAHISVDEREHTEQEFVSFLRSTAETR